MAQVLAEAEKDPTKSGTPYSNCMRDASVGVVFLSEEGLRQLAAQIS